MYAKKKFFALIAGLLALLVMGCATTTAPSKWLAPPIETQRQAYGGWISIDYQTNRLKSEIHGELIAMHPDSVFLLTADRFVAIPADKITNAKLTAYDPNVGPLALWSFLGTLSTVSHGFILILSAPIWIISGTAASSAQSYQPQLSFPKNSWPEFHKYARFPTGLPKGLDRKTLKRK